MRINPQIVGQAENAHKPILDRALAPTGTTKNQWFVLKLTAINGGTIERELLVGRVAGARKIDAVVVHQAIDELTEQGLINVDGSLTDTGWNLFRGINATVEDVVGRVYGDIPDEELATAGRVLTVITERLNAELAR